LKCQCRKTSEKFTCLKCNCQFNSNLLWPKCPNCNTNLATCTRCHQLFERTSKVKEIYCTNCKTNFITKEELKKLIEIEFWTIQEISDHFKIPIRYVHDLYGKEDSIECLICKEKGIEFKRQKLAKHLISTHQINSQTYEKLYNTKSQTDSVKQRHSEMIKKSWEKGAYNKISFQHDINKSEKSILTISNKLVFIGANKENLQRFYLRTPSGLKNPDFIVIEDQTCLNNIKSLTWEEKQNNVYNDFINGSLSIKKVLEFCGQNWHSERFNGMSLQQYTQKIIDDYKSIAIDCLVVWDYELQMDPTLTKNKIRNFTGEEELLSFPLETENSSKKCIICKKYANSYFCSKCESKQDKQFENQIENKDFISCKICGFKAQSLIKHVFNIHKLPTLRYCNFYNTDTICLNLKEKLKKISSETTKKRHQKGIYKKINCYTNINESELLLQSLSNNIIYTGGNKENYQNLSIHLLNKNRHPDFIVINDKDYLNNLDGKTWYEKEDIIAKDYNQGLLRIDKVIELCSFWHEKNFKGRTKEQYTIDMINEYSDIGIKCLVIWSDELKNIESLRAKITNFVTS